MPLWAILALSGGGLGILQGQEQQKQAQAKQMFDVAQARTSGFTGKAPTYTPTPGMMAPVLQGALAGGSLGLNIASLGQKGAAGAASEGADMPSADALTSKYSGSLAPAGNYSDGLSMAGPPSIYGRLAKRPYGLGIGD